MVSYMAEEDLDLTKTCPSCAGHNVSTNRIGQIICRDCGNITPAGSVVSERIYSKIKSLFNFTDKIKGKSKKTKKINKKGTRKRDRLKKKIKSILKIKNKAKPKPKKKVSKKRNVKKKSSKKTGK